MFIKKIFLFISILTIFFLSTINAQEKRTIMLMKLKYGDVKIELFDDVAPNHVKRIKSLADQGKYDGVAFHRVIDGFMAQTGDVQFGNTKDKGEVKANYNEQRAGTGGSKFPNLKAEFNNLPHVRGTLSMARAQDPDSANSQFFICFDSQPSLDRQYTVFGRVISGMEFVDKIKKGVPGSGAVSNPDIIISFKSIKN
jgi:peptidyl-prolyl cis-trans isomerase B (cyclophilin B)